MNSRSRVFSVGLGVLVILRLLLWAPAAWSHWDAGDPAKWVQLPDETSNGIDVAATTTLGDSFQCTSTGPITDIHIWGSFLKDAFYAPTFTLGIWNFSIPPAPFYTPRNLLWEKEFGPDQYSWRLWKKGTLETFWDPISGATGRDEEIYQFNFLIDPQEAFNQTEMSYYYLTVQATFNPEKETFFGWKTTTGLSGGLDYAVFRNADNDWGVIIFGGEPKNLSFVINSTPIPVPGSLLLLGSGLLGLGLLGRRRKGG